MTVEFAKMFGANLKLFREYAGLSQLRLAEITGLSVTCIAYLEQGRRSPSLETAWRIAKALYVNIDTLCPWREYGD